MADTAETVGAAEAANLWALGRGEANKSPAAEAATAKAAKGAAEADKRRCEAPKLQEVKDGSGRRVYSGSYAN